MIEEFSFANFRSFKEMQTLNLTAAKIKSKNPELDKDNVIADEGKAPLLKSKVIYGANASGKSNVVKALVAFLTIIHKSFSDDKVLNYLTSYQLSTETENEPSFFQIIFWSNGIKYRYGFEASSQKICSEWLYGTPLKREIPYFIRQEQEIVTLNKKYFGEGSRLRNVVQHQGGSSTLFRDNTLILTVSVLANGQKSKEIFDALKNITVISGLGDSELMQIAADQLKEKEYKRRMEDFLRHADLGVIGLEYVELTKNILDLNIPKYIAEQAEKTENPSIIIALHNKYDNNLNLISKQAFEFSSSESEGTQKMLEISPFVIRAIENGEPLIIDEFDSRFHPLITKKIISLFNSKANKNGQLVVVSHDTNLLSADLLRRDQIDFVEKDKYGASHLYTLVEFKGVRNTASFEKDYLEGKYGAIPYLGNWDELFKICDNDKED